MALENLSLSRRLLLALAPGVILTPVVISLYYCQDCQLSQMFDFLVNVIFWGYFALFGACVLAPCIPGEYFSGKRVVALVLGSSLLILPFLVLADLVSDFLPGNTVAALLGMFLVTTLLMAVLLHVVAKFRVGVKLVICLALSGVVAGLLMAFFIDRFLCLVFCDERRNLLLLIPLIMWPALVAAAVHLANRARPG